MHIFKFIVLCKLPTLLSLTHSFCTVLCNYPTLLYAPTFQLYFTLQQCNSAVRSGSDNDERWRRKLRGAAAVCDLKRTMSWLPTSSLVQQHIIPPAPSVAITLPYCVRYTMHCKVWCQLPCIWVLFRAATTAHQIKWEILWKFCERTVTGGRRTRPVWLPGWRTGYLSAVFGS